MEKIKPFLIVSLMFMMLVVVHGCAGIQIGEPEETAIMENLGYHSAYWPLRNNPKCIPIVAGPLALALATCEQDNVDIAALIHEIIDFTVVLLDNPDFQDYAGPIMQAVKAFEGMLVLDLDIAENHANTLRRTKAFLIGAKQALSDLPEGKVKRL